MPSKHHLIQLESKRATAVLFSKKWKIEASLILNLAQLISSAQLILMIQKVNLGAGFGMEKWLGHWRDKGEKKIEEPRIEMANKME